MWIEHTGNYTAGLVLEDDDGERHRVDFGDDGDAAANVTEAVGEQAIERYENVEARDDDTTRYDNE